MLLAEFCEHNRSQLRRLIRLAPSAAQILDAPDADWRAAGVADRVRSNRSAWSRRGKRSPHSLAATRAANTLQTLGGRLVVLGKRFYPPLLAEIPDPPPLLYIAGNSSALAVPQIALVGSRRCSHSGERTATEFACDLVDAGFSICSGMALGVDAAAHRGALDRDGVTVAVMGTGLDVCYPRRHESLSRAICERGALVSEFPPGTPPRRANFPLRNRIISGMSVGVLVVEAGLKSGSLVTARLALEQNREVFAVPQSLYHPGGRGCLHLLRQGATLVETLDDILAEVGSLCAASFERTATGAREVQPPEPARRVWEHLGHGSLSVDELVTQGAGDAAAVLVALQILELEGLAEHCSGLYRRRV